MKAHPFLETNLRALKKGDAAIVHWLTDQGPGPQELHSKIVSNQWGLLDWRLPSGNGLFEAIPPSRFYQKWIPQEKADTSATMIVGCNLGYGLNHVLANTPNSHKVLVLDPRPEMVLACLSHTDYRPFLQAKKLFFIPPDPKFLWKMVSQLDLQYVFGDIILRSDIPSRQLGPEYAEWARCCKEVLEDFSVGMDTLCSRQDIMISNELNNFARAMQDGSLLPLKNQGQGLSAVILGAGPSLAKFAPLMARNPGYALYTSALQTLPALQRYGLKPHVCLAIDHTMAIKEVYDRLDMEWARDIPLIYSCKLAPEVVRNYPGPTLPMWTFGGLATNIQQGKELVLDAGANVGVALVHFLTWCGVSRILLAGQDFAWSEEKTHVAGHLTDKDRFRFDPERHVKMKNRYGQTIYSAPAYVTALRILENDLKWSSVPVFNLYGGGAVIKGSKDVTWNKVVMQGLLESAPGSMEHFIRALDRARSPRPWPLFEARSPQWAASLRSARKRLEKLFKKANNNQHKIRTTLTQVLFFLRQDPLYRPYLYNEILSLAGLVHANGRYGLKEMTQCKQILKRALTKVREMDRRLVFNRKAA